MIVSKNVLARELLPRAAHLKLVGLEISEQGWAVATEANNFAVCPGCATRSRSRHSRYRRQLQDLRVQGSPVMVHL
jgi:transposase